MKTLRCLPRNSSILHASDAEFLVCSCFLSVKNFGVGSEEIFANLNCIFSSKALRSDKRADKVTVMCRAIMRVIYWAISIDTCK